MINDDTKNWDFYNALQTVFYIPGLKKLILSIAGIKRLFINAIDKEDFPTALYILKSYPDEIKDSFDEALKVSMKYGDLQIIKSLLNYVTSIPCGALHNAVYNGHSEVVELLLKHGADPNESSKYYFHYKSPLQIATGEKNSEIIKILLKNGSIFDGWEEYPDIFGAPTPADDSPVNFLLLKCHHETNVKIPHNVRGGYMRRVILSNDFVVAKYIAKFLPYLCDYDTLSYAFSHNINIFKILLKTHPEASIKRMFLYNIRNGMLDDMIIYLIEHYPQLYNQTAICYAIKKCNIPIVRYIIEKNIEFCNQITINCAIRYDCQHTFEFLINIKPEFCNKESFLRAIRYNSMNILALLKYKCPEFYVNNDI